MRPPLLFVCAENYPNVEGDRLRDYFSADVLAATGHNGVHFRANTSLIVTGAR